MVEDYGIILSNERIAEDTYKMVVRSKLSEQMNPGQFINIKVQNCFLRRPISICSIDEGEYTIIYKVVGEGTEILSLAKPKEELNVFGPLGYGFPIESHDAALIIGGGVGVPPLYEVAKRLIKNHTKVDVVLGFNSKDQAFYEEEFKALGCRVIIASMDGSIGVKGTVMDAIKAHQIQTDFVYACGPMPMLKAIEATYAKGYISFESRMACGMGACMGCVCKDKEDTKIYYRICKEGPVFPIGKVGL